MTLGYKIWLVILQPDFILWDQDRNWETQQCIHCICTYIVHKARIGTEKPNNVYIVYIVGFLSSDLGPNYTNGGEKASCDA